MQSAIHSLYLLNFVCMHDRVLVVVLSVCVSVCLSRCDFRDTDN